MYFVLCWSLQVIILIELAFHTCSRLEEITNIQDLTLSTIPLNENTTVDYSGFL